MNFNHGNVRSIFNNPGSPRSLPNGDDSPYAILLLDTEHSSRVSRFRLKYDKSTKEYLEKDISINDIQYLLDEESQQPENEPPFLLDMVVYGRKIHVTSCTIFDLLWKDTQPVEGGKRYLLRDWDVSGKIKINNEMVHVKDYSLNRCTPSTTAFSPTSFQYDTPSPGRPNPCKGASFFVEDIIQQIADVNVLPVDPIPDCSADHPYVPEGRYPVINEVKLAEVKEQLVASGSKTSSPLRLQIDCADEAMDIAVNYGESEKEPSETLYQIGGTSFDDNWLDLASEYFSVDGMVLSDPDVQNWLRIKIPGDNTPMSFHCAACVEYFEDKMGNVINKFDIMTPHGYFNKKPHKNTEKVRNHANTDVHISAMNYQYQLQKANSLEERDRIRHDYERSFDESLLPTARMIRTVFAEVITETPFMYHTVFVNLQEVNGVNLGVHHYNQMAAKSIMETISSKMHTILLQRLVENNLPFSIIVDTSTTSRNIPLLIVYIQTLEDGYPVTYYYRIISLPKGESAKETFDRFWEFIIHDDDLVPGFRDFFMRNLAFLVSDSASVMVGIRNSFHTLLRQKTRNELGHISCMAHKMALVVKAAVRVSDDEDLAYIKEFEKTVNGLYNFYSSRGSKRFQHLAETAEKYNVKVFRLRKNVVVRWSTAEHVVIDNILKDWEMLEKDLHSISGDTVNFNKFAQEQAKTLYSEITNTGNLVLYHEFVDFLGVNSIISRALQSRASILSDHVHLLIRSFTSYHVMKTEYGQRLKQFMSEVTCPDHCEPPVCTLQQIEECEHAIYKNVRLTKNESFKMYRIREKFYTRLFDAMTDYFDFERLQCMTIFDHRQIYEALELNDFLSKFMVVCDSFPIQNVRKPGFTCDLISTKVYNFINMVRTRELYKNSFGNPGALPPSQFWPFVLQNADKMLDIDEDVILFFNLLLIQSDSSAEAERGFSFVNRISGDARSSLKPETLDGLLRIKLNANKPIQDLKAFLYVREFVQTHYKVDSTTSTRRKTSKTTAYEERVSRYF